MAKILLLIEDRIVKDEKGEEYPTVAVRMLTHRAGDDTFTINEAGDGIVETRDGNAEGYEEDPRIAGARITQGMFLALTSQRLIMDGTLDRLSAYVCADVVAKEMQQQAAIAAAKAQADNDAKAEAHYERNV